MTYNIAYPFNFFAKVPDLARQNLFEEIELQDLILLSSCSKRCAMAIRTSRVCSVAIDIELRSNLIQFYMPGRSLRWQFELGKLNTGKIFKIENTPVTISQDGGLKTVLKKNLDAAFNIAVAHILYIIPSSRFKRLKWNTENDFPVDFSCKIALAAVKAVKT